MQSYLSTGQVQFGTPKQMNKMQVIGPHRASLNP
jgi:hypothetical protein